MRFDVITLFPELFAPFLTQGVTRRAFGAGGSVAVRLHQLRDFTTDTYHRVDERPYGGGPGMVMLAEPLERALGGIRGARAVEDGAASAAPLVLFSPAGRPLTHRVVAEYAADARGAILLCGRYEGVDQRFVDRHVDDELSLGDFVLSGGEIPAMALLDAVARLQPGVLGDALSSVQDSFNPAEDGLLDYPHYTRPEVLHPDSDRAEAVPEVLLSGNHAAIARWRRERQLELTARRRPELIAAARAAGRFDAADESFLAKLGL